MSRIRTMGALAVGIFSAAGMASPAVATAEAPVPCAVLNDIRGSLDSDVGAGIDGVRTVIGSPYLVGATQKRNTDVQLAMVSHGVHYIQDINRLTPVPGLAPLLENLNSASNDMNDAVSALFQLSAGGYDYGPSISLAWPQPSTWAAIDYADQKKNDVYGLVNTLQGSCSP